MEEEDTNFIKNELIEEMMFDKCFSEPDSREFVELGQVNVEPLNLGEYFVKPECAVYRVKLVVLFSGVPKTFRVIVKLLPADAALGQEDSVSEAFKSFVNEEILFNNTNFGMKHYGSEFFPKVYLVDLGKYGRPVVVLEDPVSSGFVRVLDRDLSGEEALAVTRKIAKFHKQGLDMKVSKPKVFRQFFAKFEDTTFPSTRERQIKDKFVRYE